MLLNHFGSSRIRQVVAVFIGFVLVIVVGALVMHFMKKTVQPYLGEPLPLVDIGWKSPSMVRVLLDPGHGLGTGSPARPWTEEESVVNLRVAKQTGEVLGATGLYRVFFTRLKEAQDPSIRSRARQATSKRADVFVSIHANATGNDPLEETGNHGVMVIWSPYQRNEAVRRESEWLANFLGAAYIDAGLPVYRSLQHVKVVGLNSKAGFVTTNAAVGVHADGRNLGVLRENGSPSVLVETHFLNNRSDVLFFQTDETIQRFAAATELGIRSFQAWKEGALEVGEPVCCTYIQVASRQDLAEAKAIEDHLKSVGIIDAQTVKGDIDGETWHRVRLGPYRTSEEVGVVQNGLEHHGYAESWVVHEPEAL